MVKTTVALLVLALALVGCRGADDEDIPAPRFPRTADQNVFAQFLNTAPGVPKAGAPEGEIDNVDDFPEAYYNTIDPAGSRDTFLKWRFENGFLNADGSTAACDPSDCRSAHVSFRDTKDLGYGRNMFMRQDLGSGDVAVYVENFQVDAVPGVPYGPLNFEALINNDREWNFGVNAIEFSAFPQSSSGALKFTKFYNFAGDGKRALLASGHQQNFVDLDNRGVKPMPTPCIVCHGGMGRTLVYGDSNGDKKLAPTVTGGIPGDVQAQMQTIELNTLQFADTAAGFTRADNKDGIRLINAAILDTFEYRRDNFNRQGDWNADFAIEILRGRYAGDPDNSANAHDDEFVPSDWALNDQNLYRTLVGPNCMVCHALRGTGLNDTLSLSRYEDFLAYSDRIDELVFEQGKMPLGLLNYADFWDIGNKEPAALATAIGHSERLDANQRALHPGRAVAVLAAPTIATGIDTSTDAVFDIPISGRDSAFVGDGAYQWEAFPPGVASVVPSGDTGDAVLRVNAPGPVELTLAVSGGDIEGSDATSMTVDVRDAAVAGSPITSDALTFFSADGINARLTSLGCVGCHNPEGGYPGIPLFYVPCRGDDSNVNGYDFLYRSVLARVNFDDPLSSLFLRKPINGATDITNRANTEITGYHEGGNRLGDEGDFSAVLSWILNGAPRGDLPTTPIPNEAPTCI